MIGENSHTGSVDSQAILGHLERSNLFVVPLDSERQWYRYHHLFADLLHKQLLKTDPDFVPVLHRRASKWYERAGHEIEAISHALSAQDDQRAADLIETHIPNAYVRGEFILARQWLEALPEALIRRRPMLCVARAWSLLWVYPLDPVEEWLQAAERALAEQANHTSDEDATHQILHDQVTGSIAVLRTILARRWDSTLLTKARSRSTDGLWTNTL
ncbi:MAG: hypothetical protein JXA89_10550 [Anaerolineae bacterium]|nr:hypothetical protein [Anaerolineae bacterium]